MKTHSIAVYKKRDRDGKECHTPVAAGGAHTLVPLNRRKATVNAIKWILDIHKNKRRGQLVAAQSPVSYRCTTLNMSRTVLASLDKSRWASLLLRARRPSAECRRASPGAAAGRGTGASRWAAPGQRARRTPSAAGPACPTAACATLEANDVSSAPWLRSTAAARSRTASAELPALAERLQPIGGALVGCGGGLRVPRLADVKQRR